MHFPEAVLLGGTVSSDGRCHRLHAEDGEVSKDDAHLAAHDVVGNDGWLDGGRVVQAVGALEVFVDGDGEGGIWIAKGVAVSEVEREGVVRIFERLDYEFVDVGGR